MPEAGFQYLVLAWLTVLTLPWAALAIWVSGGGLRRFLGDTLAAIAPCETCGGLGFILEAGKSTVTCPDCGGLQPPMGGAAGPPHSRSP